MKYLKYIALASALLCGAGSCSEADLDNKSIFDTEAAKRNEFNTWLLNNYIYPYNIDFKYQMEYKESDTGYNLVPADFDKAVAMAKLVKYLWIDCYAEVMDNQRAFICTYGPKMIHLIGSPAYEEGQIKLGTAEGGLKVTLYNVNTLDPVKKDVEAMNKWYFSTMHHEFAHILHQTIEFQKEFYEVSSGKQTGAGWVNISDDTALTLGFITAYGSSEVHEDFAEIVANYVTHSADWWNGRMAIAGNGATHIKQKLDIVKEYMKDSWGIDLDRLRDIVQRRSVQVTFLDLKNLKD